MKFAGKDAIIAKAPLAELLRRLEFVERVGLGYLALDRRRGDALRRRDAAASDSRGAAPGAWSSRARSTCSTKPTIGLHPRGGQHLLENLRALVDTGSTVVVVEHDAEAIRAADHLVELGPGGGGRQRRSHRRARRRRRCPLDRHGDRAPAHESADAHRASTKARSLHRGSWRARAQPKERALQGPRRPRARRRRREQLGQELALVRKVFYPALRKSLGLVTEAPGDFDSITGTKAVRRALAVDQSPIGRTPRSVPATFSASGTGSRKLYASIPKRRCAASALRAPRSTPKGGRCTACGSRARSSPRWRSCRHDLALRDVRRLAPSRNLPRWI